MSALVDFSGLWFRCLFGSFTLEHKGVGPRYINKPFLDYSSVQELYFRSTSIPELWMMMVTDIGRGRVLSENTLS